MEIPSAVINAVKETKADLAQPKPKARKPYVKKLTKRILHAIGNGLRTSSSIANALGVDKAKIQSNLCHIKARGLVYSSKQEGKVELKYHLTTDKPVLGTTDLTKKKPKAVKRKSVYNKAGVNTTNSFNTPPKAEQPMLGKYARELEVKIDQITSKLAYLEQTLVDKEKEVWTLECEVFDKKAIIKYLEEKLFALGVRV
jgi:DNA-binding transcriptional MocR family regulator